MTGRLPPRGYIAICDVSGKRGYGNRRSARKARRQMLQIEGEKASQWDIYLCQHCEMLHIGHHNKYAR
jgi:hypothetical protein